jgi:hypothetical protein
VVVLYEVGLARKCRRRIAMPVGDLDQKVAVLSYRFDRANLVLHSYTTTP